MSPRSRNFSALATRPCALIASSRLGGSAEPRPYDERCHKRPHSIAGFDGAVSQATTAAGDMAKSASHKVTTFASELEAMIERNPLGTLAGAVMARVLIGFLARGRAVYPETRHQKILRNQRTFHLSGWAARPWQLIQPPALRRAACALERPPCSAASCAE
jgi:hypothetical protein